ncbi:MAG: DUF3619 family protein [Burkholderiaceae bacterium]|nr:DUF3619 family protein [Burkholderiaceae bacterium]
MNEAEFAYRVRQALNEGLERMDYRTTFRLQRARQAALARYRPAPVVAPVPVLEPAGGRPTGPAADNGWGWLHRLGLLAPALALLLGFFAIYEWQRARTIDRIAALDFAILLDEAPVDAYADKGFGMVLKYGVPE